MSEKIHKSMVKSALPGWVPVLELGLDSKRSERFVGWLDA